MIEPAIVPDRPGAGEPAVPDRPGTGEPAVLLGVDVVEVARLERAVERGGEVFARHVTTEAERGLSPEAAALSVEAAFSVKECLIKAVGGRAPGFGWHDFEAVAGAPATWAGRLLDEAASELAASTGVALDGNAAYALHGASRDAALHRLKPRHPVNAPATGAPAVDALPVNAPIADAPTAAAPVADAPTAQVLATDTPTASEPITCEPITSEPVADPPAAGVDVVGAARWGSGGGVFVALAIVYVDRKGSARCPR
ncbi:4'-phosphopantetheinyl transferase superfamily protein [Nonomuraea sp. NPDC050691]|uniref:4'-phosphopantetheinyl transferase superfamily protein n=1 Tax=Nonomuraea sp. NPDC050691 TaxID=3155661 RepID=UPI0033D68A74